MTLTSTGTLHKIPKDLEAALALAPDVLEIWQGLTPLARNEWICYVTIVKKPETRQAHIKRLQEDLLSGQKRPCCWPGCPHRRSNAAKWFGKDKA